MPFATKQGRATWKMNCTVLSTKFKLKTVGRILPPIAPQAIVQSTWRHAFKTERYFQAIIRIYELRKIEGS